MAKLEEGWEPVGVFHLAVGSARGPIVLLRADARPEDLDTLVDGHGNMRSTGACSVLRRLGVTSSEELAALRPERLLKVRSCGRKTAAELAEMAAHVRRRGKRAR